MNVKRGTVYFELIKHPLFPMRCLNCTVDVLFRGKAKMRKIVYFRHFFTTPKYVKLET